MVAWLEPPLLEPTSELELFVLEGFAARDLCFVGVAGLPVEPDVVPVLVELFWSDVVVLALAEPAAEAAPSATAVPRAPAAPSATMPCWVRRLRRIFFSRLLVMTTRVRRKYVWFL